MPWAFSGQRSDATGLYFYNARYYSPLIGRFISADTIVPEPGNPQDLNRYSYVRGNPLKHTDTSGHCVDGLCTLVCVAAVGFVIGFGTNLASQIIEGINSGASFNEAVSKVDWGEALITGGVTAAGSILGAAVIGPLAVSVGATATAATAALGTSTSSIIGLTAEVGTAAILTGAANVGQNTLLRQIDRIREGKEVNMNTISSDLMENAGRDFQTGATLGAFGQVSSRIIDVNLPGPRKGLSFYGPKPDASVKAAGEEVVQMARGVAIPLSHTVTNTSLYEFVRDQTLSR